MHTTSNVSAARKRVPSVPPPVALDAAHWEELRTLNEGLRALESTDKAARAWIEGWVAVVAGGLAVKLALDHYAPGSLTPLWLAAVPGAFAGVVLLDILRLRFAYRQLEAGERVRLDRQRELRRLLSLDDAPVPSHND